MSFSRSNVSDAWSAGSVTYREVADLVGRFLVEALRLQRCDQAVHPLLLGNELAARGLFVEVLRHAASVPNGARRPTASVERVVGRRTTRS